MPWPLYLALSPDLPEQQVGTTDSDRRMNKQHDGIPVYGSRMTCACPWLYKGGRLHGVGALA